jgi:hypothetical protein
MYKKIAAVKPKNKDDAIKYAYAFMKSKELKIKECGFFNPFAHKVRKGFIFPADTYSAAYYENDLPTWEAFKRNPAHTTSPAFSCVACLDDNDEQRVCCAYNMGKITFSIYGDYKAAAQKAWDEILEICKTL